MEHAWGALCLLLCTQAHAASPQAIVGSNTPAMVYLEVTDDKGNFMEGGSGFIVSHDGYVVTVDHVKPDVGQTLWGVIAQRQGTRYPLEFRDADEKHDVALWQLPQAAVCRPAVTISTKRPKVLDRVLALGFPGTSGLTPAPIGITNLSSPEHGFYKADGYLEKGNSGGPVFNEAGQVVAIVQGGTMPGTANNDLIPISLAVSLINKRNVQAGLDAPVPYDDSCYSECADPSHGVEKWAVETSWKDNSGELDGGHNRQSECAKLIAAKLAVSPPGSQIELLPGEGAEETTGMWEKPKKDVLGHATYTYFCKGTFRSGPTYVTKQSPACPLRQ
jgi:hypothetical protein